MCEEKLKSRQRWLLFAVFGLFCTMQRAPYLGCILTSQTYAAHEARMLLDLLLLAVGMIALMLPRRCWRFVSVPVASIAGSVLMLLGIAFVNIPVQDAEIVVAPSLLGSCCLSVGFACFALAVFKSLSYLKLEDELPFLMTSFTASFVFGLIDLVESPPKLFLLAAVALLLTAVLLASDHCARLLEPLGKAYGKRDLGELEKKGSSRWLTPVVLAFLIVCCALPRGIYSHAGINYISTLHSLWSYGVSIAMGLGCCFVCKKVEDADRAATILSALSVPILAVGIFLFAAGEPSAASPVITSSMTVLTVVLLARLAQLAQGQRVGWLRSAGIWIIVFSIALLVTYDLVPAIASYDDNVRNGFVFPVTLVSMIAVCCLGAAALVYELLRKQQPAGKELAVGDGLPEASSEPAAPSSSLPDGFASMYGLTKREEAVAELIALGYTQKRAAEELGVSYSTIQSHMKSIYTKLGVHKKNDFLDLVARTAA